MGVSEEVTTVREQYLLPTQNGLNKEKQVRFPFCNNCG